MTARRSEHRTLPVLIALGMLLGAGLALASPGQRVGGPLRPSPQAVVIPSSSPAADLGASPSSGPRFHGDLDAVGTGCDELLAAGLPDDLGSGLPHAAHMLLANCAKVGAAGLATAAGHVSANEAKKGDHPPRSGGHGSHEAPAHGGEGSRGDGGQDGTGGSDRGGGSADGTDGRTGGPPDETPKGNNGKDAMHGKDDDHDHAGGRSDRATAAGHGGGKP